MTVKELREKETPQLQHDLVDRRKHLFHLRSQAVTEKLEDPSQLGKTRKEIARILTILHQRELELKKSKSAPLATPAPTN
jgi:large subunit ribosomal protein L29